MIQRLVQFDKIYFQLCLSEKYWASDSRNQFQNLRHSGVELQNILPPAGVGTADIWLCWEVPRALHMYSTTASPAQPSQPHCTKQKEGRCITSVTIIHAKWFCVRIRFFKVPFASEKLAIDGICRL